MTSQTKVLSNKQQICKLVELMEAHPEVATNCCTKPHLNKKWAEFAKELNVLGPPMRTVEKWMKVWTDMKYKTKKKMSTNRNEARATGGGPNVMQELDPLEETIAAVLSLDKVVDPVGKECGIQVADDEDVLIVDETPKTSRQPVVRQNDKKFAELLQLKREKLEFYKKYKNEKLHILRECLEVQKQMLAIKENSTKRI